MRKAAVVLFASVLFTGLGVSASFAGPYVSTNLVSVSVRDYGYSELNYYDT